jgi:hypothetical protein
MNFDQGPALSANSPNEFADYEETHVPYLPLPSESPQSPAWRTSPTPAPDSQAAVRLVLRSDWAVLGIALAIALAIFLIYFVILYFVLILSPGG